MSAEMIIAIGGIITGVLAWITSALVAKRAAKKDELELCREQAEKQQGQINSLISSIERWRNRYDKLYVYVLQLRLMMTNAGMTVPEMPPIINGTDYPTDFYVSPRRGRDYPSPDDENNPPPGLMNEP